MAVSDSRLSHASRRSRRPRSRIASQIVAPSRSRPIQASMAASVTASCSSAPALAMKRMPRSASFIHWIRRTPSGAGVVGPRMAATSTTEVEKAMTANTASRIWR
jgi:hypothetical protein